MQRRKPLKRSGPIKKKRPKERDEPLYRAWIRTHPCIISLNCWGPIDCCHVTSRGAGGKDRGNTVPMCRGHHQEQHRIGVYTFEQRYDLDLTIMATAYSCTAPLRFSSASTC